MAQHLVPDFELRRAPAPDAEDAAASGNIPRRGRAGFGNQSCAGLAPAGVVLRVAYPAVGIRDNFSAIGAYGGARGTAVGGCAPAGAAGAAYSARSAHDGRAGDGGLDPAGAGRHGGAGVAEAGGQPREGTGGLDKRVAGRVRGGWGAVGGYWVCEDSAR